MEQTVAPFRVGQRLHIEEQARFPDWEEPLPPLPETVWFAEREEAEWELADVVLCGSDYVKSAIKNVGGPEKRCRVVPYGVDRRFSVSTRPVRSGPLRVLTIGAVGLRKGAPYVLEVARRLKGRALFRMVGPIGVSTEARGRLSEHVELLGGVPRSDVGIHYQWADVFFLPSLNEGSAGVVYEALSAGLPVVCTPNTGSTVQDGINGFIVPIRDVDAMTEVLDRLASDNALRTDMAEKAEKRIGDYSFEDYRSRLLTTLFDSMRAG